MKAAIIIGHEKTSPGAYSIYHSKSEFAYHTEVASYLAGDFDVYNRPSIGGYKTQMRKLAEELNPKNYDLVIELHFNRFDGQADNKGEGVETVSYPGNAYSKQMGEKYCRIISEHYDTVNRGAKEATEGGRGWWFLYYMEAPAIIVEPFFCDELEAQKFLHPGVYAQQIRKWLCE